MRFSIIVPLYNKAPYVEKALESIIAQTYPDWELIVVDDGSTDGSGDVADTFLKKAVGRRQTSSSFRWLLIHKENGGVSSARNEGVAASQGEYLCFLDADDWWAPTFLEEMNQLIENYPDAGIYGTNYWYVKSGRQRVNVTTAETGYINYCKVYAEKLQMPLTSISVSIARAVFDETGGFKMKLKLGEDFDVWIRIALKYKVAFLNKPLAYYNQDVDIKSRGVGCLQKPEYHMLWNLDYLSEVEKSNPDYKKLIDNLRVYSLKPYFLSKEYHEEAKKELSKVDWSLQPNNEKSYFEKPLWQLRLKARIMKMGSKVKQFIIRLSH